MRMFLVAASVFALSIGTADLADAQGKGKGGGQGGPRAERSQGGGGGQGRGAENRQRGPDRANRGGEHRENRAERRQDRREQRANRREDRREIRTDRRQERREMRAERRDDRQERRVNRATRLDDRIERRVRRAERRAVEIRDSDQVQRLRFAPGVGLINGCPPGLARRNNGCMPPGQLRQQQRAWFDDWWDLPENDGNFFYDNGYLYRLAPTGAVTGFVPLLGGALWPGQSWPAQFTGYDVPDYFVDYYGFDDPYDYRLADGVIYGLDPETQAIQSILALVTDDEWAIGQPMPDGYDVYNVPSAYRDRYFDSADSWYRYDDGYVYQVDPTTQLIQAAIQLIT